MAQTRIGPPPYRIPLLRTGFRPFFFLAAVFAAVSVPLWLLAYRGAFRVGVYFDPVVWHSHEMVFGYTGAVITGFLLTAVRNWTSGRETARGPLLAALALLWLAARLAVIFAAYVPKMLIAVLDAPFFFVAAVVIARPIVAAKNKPNAGFPILLFLMGCASLVTHLDAFGVVTRGTAWRAATFGLGLVVLLMVTVGGRIIPNFTKWRGKVTDIRGRNLADPLAIWITGAWVAAELFPSWRLASAVTALAAAGVNAWRMVGWRGTKSIKHPALLVVHLSYAWIVVGLALRGFINLTGWGLLSMSTHALTVGGLGMMTFGMMCWVGLAHTGRPVKVARSIVVAYIFMVAAAMLRTGAWVLGPSRYAATLDAAGACWCAAFVIYLASYTRILWRPAEGGAAD